MDVEGDREEADHEAGEEVADGVDGGEGAEGDAVLFFGNQLGGERILERLFGADVKACQDKNHGEQPQGICSGAKEDRGDAGEGVAGGEHEFAAGDVVAQPAAEICRAGVENVVQGVEADGEACGSGHSMDRSERSRPVENPHGVREIAGAADAYAYEESAERKWQRLQTAA